MIVPKTTDEVNSLISDGVEENISLDYKAADALQNTEGKKKEIAKDVSAMANAAGGVIIYGVKEFDETDKKHLPEKITPINRTQFSKEQLEQIINNNISPRIEGLKIHPIQLHQQYDVIYVVEIPQSNTAHQNTKDQRYYRRFNFESVPMLDYEIRDIMNRLKHPTMVLEFEIEKNSYKINSANWLPQPPVYLGNQRIDVSPQNTHKTVYSLKIVPKNVGNIYAQYINYFVHLPKDIVDAEEAKYLKKPESEVVEFYGENTHRDIIDVIGTVGYKYGPSRFDPVLPGLRGRSEKLKLAENPVSDEREIAWTVYADNAPPKTGKIKLNQIPADLIKNEEVNE